MAQSPDEAHYRMIADRILAGAVVPFLGAGVNLTGRSESETFERRPSPAKRLRAGCLPC